VRAKEPSLTKACTISRPKSPCGVFHAFSYGNHFSATKDKAMANKSRGISQAADPVFWEILDAAKIKLKKK
jgi:hypothetical protein